MLNRNLPDLQTTSSAIFITGATGFIGRHIVSTLLKQGHAVRAMIRTGKHRDDRLPFDCEQIPVELSDVESLSKVVADSSAVIYCAGSVRGRSPADFSAANVKGVKAILGALERAPVTPPMLLVSSLAASRPQLSDYSASKYEGEQLLRDKPLLPWTILRPPAVYGPGDKEMLPGLKLARRGLLVRTGPDTQRLSLLHVDDLANAIAAWFAHWQQCLHKTYAIDDGTPAAYDWADIGEAISNGKYRSLKLPQFFLGATARLNLILAGILGYSPMLTPGKVQELIQPDWVCADNLRFKTATGWVPGLDLKRGSQQLFEMKVE